MFGTTHSSKQASGFFFDAIKLLRADESLSAEDFQGMGGLANTSPGASRVYTEDTPCCAVSSIVIRAARMTITRESFAASVSAPRNNSVPLLSPLPAAIREWFKRWLLSQTGGAAGDDRRPADYYDSHAKGVIFDAQMAAAAAFVGDATLFLHVVSRVGALSCLCATRVLFFSRA